jgi:polyphosphate kinase
VLVQDKILAKQLLEILEIQLKDNVKARNLEGELRNTFVHNKLKPVRAQEQIAQYLNKPRQ